jgi:chromosome segregation ATPase
MASGDEKPDLEALQELEDVLRHFEAELASWRRRALTSEQRLADVTRGEGGAPGRIAELETENHTLEDRVAQAKGRVTDLLDRLRFLEQQSDNGGS